MVQTSLGSEKPSINEPFKSGDEMASAAAAAWLSRPVLWIVGLLLLAALAVALLPQGWVSRLQGGAAPETMPVLTTPAGLMAPSASTPPDDAPPNSASPLVPVGDAAEASASATAVDPAAAPAVTAEAPVVAASAATEPGVAVSASGLLSIRAVSESWIEVVNGSGAQVVQRVLKPAEVLDFSTAPPYSVVLGRADAVQVTVRGQPFDVMPYARNSVARFEVK
jgi:cytoskeleton protein RodZ